MNYAAIVIQVCLALSLIACGGGDLSIENPGGRGKALELRFPPGQAVEHRLPFRVTGGVPPYESSIEDCPDWVTLFPDQGILAGMAPVAENDRSFFCTYRVTESDPGIRRQRSVTYGLRLQVGPVDRGAWRFRTRTILGSEHPLHRETDVAQDFVILPQAVGGSDMETYRLLDIQYPLAAPAPPLAFDANTRVLSYRHTGVDPILDTPTTFRYEVSAGGSVHDTLCVDITFLDKDEDDLLDGVNVRVRDDARWVEDEQEYRCPDRHPPPSSSDAPPSNPVHSALAPVHARRALDVAHAAVRDRVRGWSPGAPRTLSAFVPAVGFASLSGQSEGFDYSGSSQSLSAGAELGRGAWQAGLVASVTRTDLRYRAAAGLAERGYRSGEHDTEILSAHPFAAWHMPSGGHFWASLGAGTGQLRHRDELGFPSRSSSDVRLWAHAVGGALPIADVLSGELEAEAGIESFAFEIEGGDRISSSLPTMRGRDYRAGLAWSAPVAGAPSLSVAYKHLTGDGAEGGRLEAAGSVSAEGVFDPRLTVTGKAEGSFGLGDHDQDSWGFAGGVRFAPGEARRGLGLKVDTHLASPDNGGSSDAGIRGEAGYGLWGGPFLGTMRPYVGLIRFSGDGSLRRALGVDLRDTPDSRAKVEVYDRPRDRLRAIRFSLNHRF